MATRSPGPMPSRSRPSGLGPGPGGQLGEGQRAPGPGRLVGLVDQAHPFRVGHLGAVQEVSDVELNDHGSPRSARADRVPVAGAPIESNRRPARVGPSRHRLDSLRAMPTPRIAVGPVASSFATEAVAAGGGTVVDVGDGPDALVWLDPVEVQALADRIAATPEPPLGAAAVRRGRAGAWPSACSITTTSGPAPRAPTPSRWPSTPWPCPWPASGTCPPGSPPGHGASRPGPASTTRR